MKKINIYSIVFALFFSVGLQAQQVMLMTSAMNNVEPGANIHLDVQVANFTQVTGTQFSMNWDANVLQFVGIDNFGLPGLSLDGNFGTLDVSQGKLRFAWYQQELTGVTLNDMSTIFSVWFKTISEPPASTQVTISNDPIVVEVVGVQGVLNYEIENGMITFAGVNASTETITEDFVLFQNSPNPFTDLTYISFNLDAGTQARLSIYDQSGKSILQQNRFFNAGFHKIAVNRDLFQNSGMYFYTLETKRAIATRQLIAH